MQPDNRDLNEIQQPLNFLHLCDYLYNMELNSTMRFKLESDPNPQTLMIEIKDKVNEISNAVGEGNIEYEFLAIYESPLLTVIKISKYEYNNIISSRELKDLGIDPSKVLTTKNVKDLEALINQINNARNN